MFSFVRTSRVQILFEAISILSIGFVFVSALSSFTASLCKNAFDEMSIHIHVRSGMPQFPGGDVRCCGVVRNVLCSSLVLPLCHRFSEAKYVCARSGMLLLLALPILFQRYLGCRPWSFKPFEIYSISVLRGHTINTISRYRSAGHDCNWLRLPGFQSLILRFWWSYPILRILVVFPTSYVKYFLWNCVIIMGVLIPPGHFRKDSLVSERLPDGLYLSHFLPESIHFPRKTDSSMKVHCELCTSSNFED